jgi:hypothetical protein
MATAVAERRYSATSLPTIPQQARRRRRSPVVDDPADVVSNVVDRQLHVGRTRLPLVAFGLGGIHVEILGAVRFRRDAAGLLRDIKGVRLLQGYRGRPPADIDALRELLLRISRLAIDIPEIEAVDLNPVIALAPGHGCRIANARIRVRPLPPLMQVPRC